MGQAKKKRFCPALTKDITAVECGENRLSRYACPESCPFNPFSAANYDQQLAIEDHLDAAILDAVARDHGNPAALAERFRAAGDANPAHGQHAAVVRHFFFDRDAAGRTFADRWSASGLARERNDDQVLFRGKRQMRVVLLEIRQIVNDGEFLAVDLLSPGSPPLRFVDRMVAATAARFATFLTWVFPSPHFWRVSGTGIGVTEVAPFPPLEVLDACVRHLHGPDEPDARRRWLADNFARIDDVLFATGQARRREMLSSMDAYFGSATYDLRGTLAECHAALASSPDVDRDDLAEDEAAKGFQSAYVWFDRGQGNGPSLPGRRVLGRILVGKVTLQVDAAGGARLDDLRRNVETRLGARVTFVKERRDNLAGQLLAQQKDFDRALVPARLLENPSRFEMASSRLPAPPAGVDPKDYQAAARAEMQALLLETPVPALGGLTPLQAATAPERHAELVEWAKGLVRQHDNTNLRTGRTDDINPLLRRLGLTELDVPAPPPRAIPADEDAPADEFGDDEDFDDDEDLANDDEFDEDEDEDFDEAVEGSATSESASDWSAPPLPKQPLNFEDALTRLRQGADAFTTAAAAIDELEETAPAVLDELWALSESIMSEDEFDLVVVFVTQIWFALVPRGVVPLMNLERLKAGVASRWKLLESTGKLSRATMEKLMMDCPQPDLYAAVSAQLIEANTTAPRPVRLSPEATMHTLILLGAFITELDRALRA